MLIKKEATLEKIPLLKKLCPLDTPFFVRITWMIVDKA